MTNPTPDRSSDTTVPHLTVVVPAFNEEENVVPLAEEIVGALDQLPGGFELILVDGSTYPKPGRFLLIDRQVDPTTGTFKVGAQFANPERFGQVIIGTGGHGYRQIAGQTV